jgi:hypothetical protein
MAAELPTGAGVATKAAETLLTPPERSAAFPGALLIAAGAFLIVWALRDWGVLDKASEPAA